MKKSVEPYHRISQTVYFSEGSIKLEDLDREAIIEKAWNQKSWWAGQNKTVAEQFDTSRIQNVTVQFVVDHERAYDEYDCCDVRIYALVEGEIPKTPEEIKAEEDKAAKARKAQLERNKKARETKKKKELEEKEKLAKKVASDPELLAMVKAQL